MDEVIRLLANWFVGLFVLLIVQLIAFLYAYSKKRIDFIDVVWGLSFVIVGLFYLLINAEKINVAIILALICIVIWGLRLSYHIFNRFKNKKEQDIRYTNLTKGYIDKPLIVYIKIFATQAILANFIMTVFFMLAHSNKYNVATVSIGLAVWIFGFIFESIADRQLKKHIQQKNSDIMKTGLWKYSRHPNYFGEVTQWWGLWILSLGSSCGFFGLVGPVFITTLIVFVSGIPLLEKHMAKKDGWHEYKKTTSIFFPLPKLKK